MAEGEQQPPRHPVADPAHDRIRRRAVRALEVPVHDQLELGPLGTVDVVLGGEWGRQFRHGVELDRSSPGERHRDTDCARRRRDRTGSARRPDLDPVPDRPGARRPGNRLHPRRPEPASSSPRSSSSSSCRRCCSRRATGPRPEELRAELLPLTWLVLGLSLVTMVAVAVVAETVIPSINWAEAFVLGAIVAPTDPVSAIATFERVGISNRVATLVEGESMVNDAVALVSLQGRPRRRRERRTHRGDGPSTTWSLSVIGGIAIGLVARLARGEGDAPPERPAAGHPAHRAAGLRARSRSRTGSAPRACWRRSAAASTPAGARTRSSMPTLGSTRSRSGACSIFALNAILFVLVGLQFPEMLRNVGETVLGRGDRRLRPVDLGGRGRGEDRSGSSSRCRSGGSSRAPATLVAGRGLAREPADRLERNARRRLAGGRAGAALHARLGRAVRLA